MNRLWITNNRNELVRFITEAQPIFDEVKDPQGAANSTKHRRSQI